METQSINKFEGKMKDYLNPFETERFSLIHREATKTEVEWLRLKSIMSRNTEYLNFKEGTIKKWVKPYFKGKGIFIKKEYVIKKS